MSIYLNLFSTWASSFDIFCAMARFCSCFACQRWRRQPQGKPADHDDETATVHPRVPRWNTEMIVHNVAKTRLIWWKSQHRLWRKGTHPWFSTTYLEPETTDSADAYVGTYTVTLHKWQSLTTSDDHVNQHILHSIRPRCASNAYEHVAVGSCMVICALGTSNIFVSWDKCMGFEPQS